MLISSVKVQRTLKFGIYFFTIANNVATKSNCTEGDVRLVGGSTHYEGRVEVCVNRAWGSVCAYSQWSSQDAKIVCNNIGALTLGILYKLTCELISL